LPSFGDPCHQPQSGSNGNAENFAAEIGSQQTSWSTVIPKYLFQATYFTALVKDKASGRKVALSGGQASSFLPVFCHDLQQFDFGARAPLGASRKKDWIRSSSRLWRVTIMVVSFISYLAGGLIIGSHAKSVNPETDQDRVQKYSREARCKAKYLEQCRFRNPMNNDCGHHAIEYTWCMKGDES